ncbi:hypothetical protein MBLNU230_g0896t1 [Neophaeotheca triangularis]
MAASHEQINQVSGPDSMSKPPQAGGSSMDAGGPSSGRPPMNSRNPSTVPDGQGGGGAKKKRHRGGKKRRNRRQSFLAPSEATDTANEEPQQRPTLQNIARPSAQEASFYRLQSGAGSNTSLDSEALLDHRDQGPRQRSRRQSLQGSFARASLPFNRQQGRGSQTSGQAGGLRSRMVGRQSAVAEEDDEDTTDRTPLLSASRPNTGSRQGSSTTQGGYGGMFRRRGSVASGSSSKKKGMNSHRHADIDEEEFDVNNPPSVPGSPKLGSLDDMMINEMSSSGPGKNRDAVINIDGGDEADEHLLSSSSESLKRRATVADLAERDVCFPVDAGLSEIGEEDDHHSTAGSSGRKSRRRGRRQWPDLEMLQEWSREEKEERTQEQIRAKKISEPVLVGGRLRSRKPIWHREEDDMPFRFTYFNEMLEETIHARAISDLCQDGTTFKDLFLPDPLEYSDDDTEDDEFGEESAMHCHPTSHSMNGRVMGGHQSKKQSVPSERGDPDTSKSGTGSNTPSGPQERGQSRKRASKRYGPRPTFWLDVLKPTEMEMKVLAKAFGIHQLTTEDILMEEPREKVELFQNYYFINYRSFEQDKDDEDYMEPINFYGVVFRDGVITFHHAMTPHPANVRRRIRQLNDYMSPTADWISYAIIDDITDVFAPLVQQIESEVDEIDDDILYLHTHSGDEKKNLEEKHRNSDGKKSNFEKMSGHPNNSERGQAYNSNNNGNNTANSNSNCNGGREIQTQGDMGAEKAKGEKTAGETGGDMLRRVGECRKKVMGLYRLLGNKADVIKGFAKRCNEHWEVAPRSEIGLYLGDIQDHIVTMTGNLSHYENLLSRAHSNYLAQINIRMNERAEQTSDVLGKLTVLGTIVLPMNIITGMWGMNVWVPWQGDEGNLTWFWLITGGLALFGVVSFFIAKRVYGIV